MQTCFGATALSGNLRFVDKESLSQGLALSANKKLAVANSAPTGVENEEGLSRH
jgi:hypothetical protein